jgi:hypothetical protein
VHILALEITNMIYFLSPSFNHINFAFVLIKSLFLSEYGNLGSGLQIYSCVLRNFKGQSTQFYI